jgi:hypothetical protein
MNVGDEVAFLIPESGPPPRAKGVVTAIRDGVVTVTADFYVSEERCEPWSVAIAEAMLRPEFRD